MKLATAVDSGHDHRTASEHIEEFHADQQIVVSLLELGAHVLAGQAPQPLGVNVLGPGFTPDQLGDRVDKFWI